MKFRLLDCQNANFLVTPNQIHHIFVKARCSSSSYDCYAQRSVETDSEHVSDHVWSRSF